MMKLRLVWADALLLMPGVLLCLFGIVTMYSPDIFSAFAERQAIWMCIALVVCLFLSQSSYGVLENTKVIMTMYALCCTLLVVTLIVGSVVKGAQSWIHLGLFAVQPVDPAKFVLVVLLAKYFTRRHVEIARIRHLFISGAYAGVVALLVLLQPDFGSAMMLGALWFGVILASGIPWKYILGLLLVGALAVTLAWMFVFKEYQKERIITFIDPMRDIKGSGYNAHQSVIAIGSGGILGKGIGYGTQSKLQFLPEYETDFIFAAFAEEWGLVGVILVMLLFTIIIMRLLVLAWYAASNFESLCMIGTAALFTAEIAVNVGMNVGIAPVTGVALPFMSYGGSHLVVEFALLGLAIAMSRRSLVAHRSDLEREMLSPERVFI
jgi:rod shape determining protein RodA